MFLTEKVNIFFRNVNKTINIFHGDTFFSFFFSSVFSESEKKQLNSHISLENRRTVMIQVSTDSYFHNGQLCFYNVSGKIDISAPK